MSPSPLERYNRCFATSQPRSKPPTTVGEPQRRAFLVPAPGEQHTFGLFILERCLYRAGWQVDALPTYDAAEVRRYLRDHPVHLIGVSASCDRFLDGAAAAIQRMRDECERDELAVMVGGQPFCTNQELAREVGADATATDARQAVLTADTLVAKLVGDQYRRRIN